MLDNTITNTQRNRFQKIVLEHMKAIPPQEWSRLRALADNPNGCIDFDEVFNPNATPEDLVVKSLCFCETRPIEASEKLDGKPVKIAEIDGHPVFYVDGAGYYYWGPNMKADVMSEILDISVTWPVYPPGF